MDDGEYVCQVRAEDEEEEGGEVEEVEEEEEEEWEEEGEDFRSYFKYSFFFSSKLWDLWVQFYFRITKTSVLFLKHCLSYFQTFNSNSHAQACYFLKFQYFVSNICFLIFQTVSFIYSNILLLSISLIFFSLLRAVIKIIRKGWRNFDRTMRNRKEKKIIKISSKILRNSC